MPKMPIFLGFSLLNMIVTVYRNPEIMTGFFLKAGNDAKELS